MTSYPGDFFERYKHKGILIDSNILLLFIVGATNLDRIEKFKRTKQFQKSDYEILVKLLSQFSKIITTPNILTEVNSLSGQLEDPERSQCRLMLANLLRNFSEYYLESLTVANSEKFAKFGLTDCGITSLAQGKYLVLTDDFPLVNYLQSLGIDVINFNNIRVYDWE